MVACLHGTKIQLVIVYWIELVHQVGVGRGVNISSL